MAVSVKRRISYGKASATPIELAAPGNMLSQTLIFMEWIKPVAKDPDRLSEYHPVHWELSVSAYFTPTYRSHVAEGMEGKAWHLPGVVITPWFEGRIARAVIAVAIFPKLSVAAYEKAEFTFTAPDAEPAAGAYHAADITIMDTEIPTTDNSTIGLFALPFNASQVPFSAKHSP